MNERPGIGPRVEQWVNLDDVARAAAPFLSRQARDYYAGGARDEVTLRENRAAWSRIRLRYRTLVDVRGRDLSVEILGRRRPLPMLAAPTAFHALAHPDGELATARGVGAAGAPMVLSTLSTRSIEEVAAAATGPLWFQLYVYRDRGVTRALVERAEAAGCEAIVLTVDAAEIGTRERDRRNRFHLPPGLEVKNLQGAGLQSLPRDERGSALSRYVRELLDPGLTWEAVSWLSEISALPIVVKGVVHPDDARLAAERGAAAVVVSNHGGRQLDTALPTAEALGPAVEAAGGRCEVLVDGGIRRGTDVIKALAMGARGVMLGRPVLWGLAAGGAAGVARVFELLAAELLEGMALCGCRSLEGLPPDLVAPPRG